MSARRVHAVAWSGLALVALALLAAWLAWSEADVWAGWVEAEECRAPRYAERVVIASVFRTRANTWSNLAYVLVGLYALALAAHDARAPGPGQVRRTPALSALFGLGCLVLGAGSSLFHASLTRVGQHLDVAAMYLPLLALLAVSASRLSPRIATWPRLAVAWAIAGVLLFVFKWQMSAIVWMPVLILVVVATRALERLRGLGRSALRWSLLSLACLVAAVACRDLDVAGRFSSPDAWLQGHAVWHLLSAAALWLGYLDQRLEPRLPDDGASRPDPAGRVRAGERE